MDKAAKRHGARCVALEFRTPLTSARISAQHSVSRRDSSVDLRTGAQRCEAREHHEGGVDRTNRECRRIVRIMSDESRPDPEERGL